MFFVFYPIDVIFLDKDKKIIEIKQKFLPFSFYNSKKEASCIIELQNGSVDKFRLKIGEKIDID